MLDETRQELAKAQTDARRRLSALQARIPTLKVHLLGVEWEQINGFNDTTTRSLCSSCNTHAWYEYHYQPRRPASPPTQATDTP